jgi:hypothetical protein
MAAACVTVTACADGYVPQTPVDTGPTSTDSDSSSGDVSERPGDTSPNDHADASLDTNTRSSDTNDVPDDDAGQPGVCTPDHDGIIERDEFPAEPGRSAPYRVAGDITVDTRGTTQSNTRVWDFSGSYADERNTTLQLQAVDDQWFADDFPDASYVTRLSALEGEETLGIYKLTSDALLLQGAVSPEDGLYATELEYDPDVPILKFPMQQGDSWSIDSDVTGTYNGTPVGVISETYDIEVDARGEVVTPYGRFPALRVYTQLDRQWGWFPESVRTMTFAVECFGTVATARSDGNAETKHFEQAAELRRLNK